MAVTKGSDNPFPSVLFEEHVDPATPPAGHQRLFVDTDHVLKLIDDGGTVSDVGGSGGGDVATDVIWNAKGDLAGGTGSDTAARLAVGANDTILMADSGQTTGLKWVGSQTPSTQAFSDAAAEGTADTYARGDHKHAMPANPGGGGLTVPTLVQFKNSGTGNTALTLTLDSAPVSGNILVLGSFSNGNAGLSTVANTNVTWTKVATGTANSSTILNIWVGLVSGTGGTTVTITKSGGNSVWSVCEYSGVTVTPTGGTPVTSNDVRVPAVLPATTAGHVVAFAGAGVSQNQSTMMAPSIPGSGVLGMSMCVVGLAYSLGGQVLSSIYSVDGAGASALIVEVT